MIFIANNTREIEKENHNLQLNISKINENIKINKLELITHHNSSYLKKLYLLYFENKNEKINPNIVSIKQLSENKSNIKLINANR